MSLACAVCGSGRVTETVETETGLKALCDTCYQPVAEEARWQEGRAARRLSQGLAALGRVRGRMQA